VVGSVVMNPGEAFDPNPFFLAIEFGLGAIIVLVKIMGRRFPAFNKRWMDWVEFGFLAIATLILMRFAFPGWAKLAGVKNTLIFVVPYVAVALWIAVMLLFASALQVSKKRLDEFDAKNEEKASEIESRIDDLRREATESNQVQEARLNNAREEFSVSLGSLREITKAHSEELQNSAIFRNQVLDELVKIIGNARLDVDPKTKRITRVAQATYPNIEDLSEVVVEMRQDLRNYGVKLTHHQNEEAERDLSPEELLGKIAKKDRV
jgi:hypothetical protein